MYAWNISFILFFLIITHICLPSSLKTDWHRTFYQYLAKFPLTYKSWNFKFLPCLEPCTYLPRVWPCPSSTTRGGRSLVSPWHGGGRAGPGPHPTPKKSPPWISSLHGVWHVRPRYVQEASPFQPRVRRRHRDIYTSEYLHFFVTEYNWFSYSVLHALVHDPQAVEGSSTSTEKEAPVSCAWLASVAKTPRHSWGLFWEAKN